MFYANITFFPTDGRPSASTGENVKQRNIKHEQFN